MKKKLAIILALLCIFSLLVACGNNEGDIGNDEEETESDRDEDKGNSDSSDISNITSESAENSLESIPNLPSAEDTAIMETWVVKDGGYYCFYTFKKGGFFEIERKNENESFIEYGSYGVFDGKLDIYIKYDGYSKPFITDASYTINGDNLSISFDSRNLDLTKESVAVVPDFNPEPTEDPVEPDISDVSEVISESDITGPTTDTDYPDDPAGELAEAIVGNWHITEGEGADAIVLNFTFNENGTLFYYFSDVDISGTYSIENGKINAVIGAGGQQQTLFNNCPISVNNDKLTITVEGQALVLSKGHESIGGDIGGDYTGENDDALIGVWSYTEDGQTIEFTIEYDGKITFYTSGVTFSGDYMIKDSKITIKVNILGEITTFCQNAEYSVSGNTLTLSVDGSSIVLTKKNSI